MLREDWDALHSEENLLSHAMTVEQSIRQWELLQTAFEWQLQQTAILFTQERWNALAELQARLQRLVE